MFSQKKLYKNFGKKVKYFREKLGLNQVEFSKLVDMDSSSISNIECGKAFVSSIKLVKFCNVLDIKPVELFDFDNLYFRDDMQDEKAINITNLIKSLNTAQLDIVYDFIKFINKING